MLEHQAALQAQADAIVAALALDEALRRIGNPIRVGSSALGLMVRRDIDITVVCDRLDRATHGAVARLAADLMLHPRIGQVRFRKDCDAWNRTPQDYPDGLYLGLVYRTESEDDWSFDIWFVDEPARQPDLDHLRTLLPRLTTAARQTILAIKTALAARTSAEGRPVASFLVYDAVLNGGVRNTVEFDDWLKRRRG